MHGDITEDSKLETTITFAGKRVKQFSMNPDRSHMSLDVEIASEIHEWKVMHWTPQHPNLYDVNFRLYVGGELVDEVDSYFGMRKISIKNGQVLLNNSPFYQKLLLDQGY